MKLRWVALWVALAACGRTEPYRARPAASSDGGAGAGGGIGGGAGGAGGAAVEPLLIDLDRGVLTAHRLDGSAAFSQRLTSTHLRTFHLASGAGVVAWLLRDAAGTSLGLTQRDGVARFRNDTFGALLAWTSATGTVTTNGVSGMLVRGQTSEPISLAPVQGATSTAHVPAVDGQRRLTWVSVPTGSARLASAPVLGTTDLRLVGDRLYGTNGAAVVESTPTEERTAPAPFALPQLLAANQARQALLIDPTAVSLVVARFTTPVEVAPLKLVNGSLPLASAYTELAFELDEEGRVYATFAAPEALQVFRTASLGQTWEKVAEVPRSALATTVRLERHGRSLLVLGTQARGPFVDDAVYAAVVSIDGLVQRELSLGGAQTVVLPLLPVALTADGARAAWWAVNGSEMTLRWVDLASGTSLEVETRPRPMGTPTVALPVLTWLEGG